MWEIKSILAISLKEIKMDNKGLVSIITPTYNCGSFIEATIKSVKNQTYENWELLIVDDCSTDNTSEVATWYAKDDNRIKYCCLSTNSGAAEARNLGLRLAKGRWIAFLDSDDLWLPNKLMEQINFMIHRNIAFSYHKYVEISEQDEELGIEVSGIKKISKLQMYSCCWPGCLSVMYERDKIGLLQIANIKKNNDTALWLKAIKKTQCYFLNETLGKYRRRQGSITPTSLWKRIWAHYPLFRVAEGMNPVLATFWTLVNVAGNTYKKIFFVKKVSKRIKPMC